MIYKIKKTKRKIKPKPNPKPRRKKLQFYRLYIETFFQVYLSQNSRCFLQGLQLKYVKNYNKSVQIKILEILLLMYTMLEESLVELITDLLKW